MQWITIFFSSSIGRKLIMSLTGLFLILFLVIHLIGNLQLLKNDGGEAFNIYAAFMVGNPLIKTVSFGLYFFIILHAFLGLFIWKQNKDAKGSGYAVQNSQKTSWASKNMALLGTLILAFLFIHMGDFWYKMKFTDQLPLVNYEGLDEPIKDLYSRVAMAFSQLWIVIVYIIGMLVLAFHLWHGFQSAFQTIGWNHKKYTPIIKGLGKIYSIIVPLGYIIIPVYHYFFMR